MPLVLFGLTISPRWGSSSDEPPNMARLNINIRRRPMLWDRSSGQAYHWSLNQLFGGVWSSLSDEPSTITGAPPTVACVYWHTVIYCFHQQVHTSEAQHVANVRPPIGPCSRGGLSTDVSRAFVHAKCLLGEDTEYWLFRGTQSKVYVPGPSNRR